MSSGTFGSIMSSCEGNIDDVIVLHVNTTKCELRAKMILQSHTCRVATQCRGRLDHTYYTSPSNGTCYIC